MLIRQFVKECFKKIYMNSLNNSNIFLNCTPIKRRYQNAATLMLSSKLFYSCSRLNQFNNFNFLSPTSCFSHVNNTIIRHYSSRKSDDFPLLTSLKSKGYPSTLASISNFFLTYLVIKPYMDQSFSTSEFLQTSKKVVEIVSNKIADGNIDDLKDLVTDNVLEEIKLNLPKFSVDQRRDLAVTGDELSYTFMDNIKLNIDEDETKSLEILTIHHAFKGIEEIKKLSTNFNMFNAEEMEKVMKNKPRPFVLTYRFYRKFNESVDASDWVINGLQHQSGISLKIGDFF